MNPQPMNYYLVSFVGGPARSKTPIYSVPASWIRWDEHNKGLVIVAYPEEPWQVTCHRVINNEGPQDSWNSFFAEIQGMSSSYNLMIRSVNERRTVRDLEIPPLMTPPPGPSHSSTSAPAEQTCAAHQIGGRADVRMPGCDVAAEEGENEINEARGTVHRSEELTRSQESLRRAELRKIVNSATNALDLAQLLTQAIFFNNDLIKCFNVGKNVFRSDGSFNNRAVDVLTEFVLATGRSKKWKILSKKIIKRVITFAESQVVEDSTE